MTAMAIGARLRQIASQDPGRLALVFASPRGDDVRLTYGEFDRAVNRFARLLRERGVDENSTVVVGLPNSPAHHIATWAAWKLGSMVLPLDASLPGNEREQLLRLADPAVIVAEWDLPCVSAEEIAAPGFDDGPINEKVPHPGKAIASGGSTGRPKLIVDPSPLLFDPGKRFFAADRVGVRPHQVQLISGPLYHNSPFAWANLIGIPNAHTLVVMPRFDAAQAVELIQRYQVQFAVLVPTMMRRILQLPDLTPATFSSIESIVHLAAPCPPWVKRAFIQLVGAERLWEGFGGSEAVGEFMIRGDDWLAHPGSVGQPANCEVVILDENGRPCPVGTVGEIYTRPNASGPTYEYRGAHPLASTADGYVSLGDMGSVDAEGYLYPADRRTDLIITGGANVYPAEVEAALSEHPAVEDVVVIGLPDEDLGRRVHAIVQLGDAPKPPTTELDAHCVERLAKYKVPRTYEFVAMLPRNDAGKVRRSQLREARETDPPAGTRGH